MLDAGARQTNTWAPARGGGGRGAKFRQARQACSDIAGLFCWCGTRMRIVALVCSFMLVCCSSGGNKKGLFFYICFGWR
jgi:hypothetical protein